MDPFSISVACGLFVISPLGHSGVRLTYLCSILATTSWFFFPARKQRVLFWRTEGDQFAFPQVLFNVTNSCFPPSTLWLRSKSRNMYFCNLLSWSICHSQEFQQTKSTLDHTMEWFSQVSLNIWADLDKNLSLWFWNATVWCFSIPLLHWCYKPNSDQIAIGFIH